MNALHHCYTNRYGIYYFRIRIPASLLLYAGQSEVRFSLRTKQRRMAAIRASKALSRTLGILAAVATVAEKSMDTGTPEINSISTSEIQLYWQNLLKQNDNNEVDALNALMKIAVKWIKNYHPEQVDEIYDRYSHEDLEEIGFAAIKQMTSEAITPEEIIQAKAPASVETQSNYGTSTHSNKTIKDAVDAYILAQKIRKKWGNPAEEESRLRVLQALMESIANGRQLADLTADDWHICFALPAYLPKFTTTENISNRIPAILSAFYSGDTPKAGCIARGTVTEHQIRVKALCKLSSKRDWIHRNFLDDTPIDKPSRRERAKESYETMTLDEIDSLLHGHLYQSEPRHDRREKLIEWRFWMLPVALYTGMRQQEIAQLSVTDIRVNLDTGIVYIDVNEDEPGKKVKSDAGIRMIPLHDELIRAGFVDYVKEIKDRGDKHLFPDLWIDSSNQSLLAPETNRVNKFFNGDGSSHRGYFKACGVTRNKVVFHSARHTFVNQLRQNNVADEKIAGLVGHEKLHMTAHYGDDHPLKLLKDIVDKLNYGPAGSLNHVRIEKYRTRFKSRSRRRPV